MANACPTMKLICSGSTKQPNNVATPPITQANNLNIAIRSHAVLCGRKIRPYTSCASAPVIETSRPENVDMNAANAPAQVMPLRMDPQGRPCGAALPPASTAVADAVVAAATPGPDPAEGVDAIRSRALGSSSTILSVPLAPIPE